MNTKKMLPLFVLVPVVVVLGVALGVLNHADTEEEDTSIALCSLDADSVIAIAYKDASDGATLESALTKTDDTWTLDSDPALPLDQSKAQGVADSILYGKGGFGQVVFACDFLHQCIGGVFVQYTDCGRVALEHLFCKCVNVITFHNTRPPYVNIFFSVLSIAQERISHNSKIVWHTLSLQERRK